MEWKEEFSVGIDEIDEQHKILFGCITLLEQAVSEQQRWSAVHSALVQLAHYVEIHFAVEESLMRLHAYPRLAQHIEQHRQFSARMDKLKEKSLSVDVTEEMIAFLREWWAQHIMHSDKHYAIHLPTASVVPTARS